MELLRAQPTQISIGGTYIDGFIGEDGRYYISLKLMARINLIPANKSKAQLEAITGIGFLKYGVPLTSTSETGAFDALPVDIFAELVQKLSVAGNTLAQELLGGREDGDTLVVTKNELREANKRTEKLIQLDLWDELGGEMEVKCLVGDIDLLTSTQIIEVKAVKQWKAALGQIIVYGYYYPSHQKRIHLFGETQECYLELIRSHCTRFGVELTWS